VRPRLAQKAWNVPVRWAIHNARTLRTSGCFQRMPDDLLARPLHRAGSHRQPSAPGLLVLDPGPVVLHISDQLGQGMVESRFPGPYLLERPQDLPDAIREEPPEFLLPQALAPAGLLG
jgi:hypothetical protein